LIGYLLLPITYTLFTFFYAVYGAILYVVGPFVLALMPSRTLGQLGRSFFTNMMVFQAWGLLYAIFQALMSALQITNPNQFGNSFLQAFVGSSQVVMMSVASVLLSIMIALIPFIASRIVRGDIGSTLMTVISGAVTAGAVASGLALSAGEGAARGRVLAPAGPPSPPSTGPAGTSIGASSPSQNSAVSGTAAIAASGAPPSLSAGSASAPEAATGSTASASSALRNPSTGQVFSWNGSGWQDAGHVGATDNASTSTHGSTNWRGGLGYTPRGYTGHNLAGFAAWHAGHMAGRTMRWIGMGKES
jgi:hypothetical protein